MKPYQALIWSEWRQMRGNVIALGSVTVLLWLLMLAVETAQFMSLFFFRHAMEGFGHPDAPPHESGLLPSSFLPSLSHWAVPLGSCSRAH